MYSVIQLNRGNKRKSSLPILPYHLIDFRSKRTTTATKKPIKGQNQLRPSIAGKKPDVSKQKGNSISNVRAGTANRRATTNGASNSNPTEDVKEDIDKIKDTPEEEKKFEAGNHMEVDLVDMLGNETIQLNFHIQ